MSSRPEILFPLFGALDGLDGVGPKTAAHMGQLGINTPRDLLFTLPHGVIDRRLRDSVADLPPGSTATVKVRIESHHPPPTRGRPYRISVRDAGAGFDLVFFHAREAYLRKQLPEGATRIVSGKLDLFDARVQMPHPDHILTPDAGDDLADFEPVYPAGAGVSAKVMRKAAQGALARAPALDEWIEPGLLARQTWPGWSDALQAAHHPRGAGDLGSATPARERLAYDEVFAHQLTLALARLATRRAPARACIGDGRLRDKVLAALPYRPTGAQTRVLDEIAADMARPQRMNRLLQGDVGAGKTLVALMALLIAVEAGGQGVLMAPTEVLARQHAANLAPLAQTAGVQITLLTGRDKGAARQQKLADLASGRTDILIGTHAVFQADIALADLRLAVIDEQHRFGVSQRLELAQKGQGAHVLVMTATPIPRSLALAQYGDMDVSRLDEKPPGRSPVTTALISAGRLEEVVAHLQKALGEGRQAYWVCPLVEESELSDLTAAEARFRDLRAALPEGQVGLVHGQMAPADKDAAMADFVAGRTRLLVATTVIEVGVDVPNATIMVVERAESFGLAQLHQLRGRVGRGAGASTCLLIYRPPLSDTGRKRLEILRESEDGFRIAEEDLALRGAGDLIGTAQSGLPRFRIADLERQAGLLALARDDARYLLTQDPDLTGPRGQAARVLLWLMEQDKAIRLISVG